MDIAGLLAFNVVTSIATLVMITIGLGVIYGMMKVINLAHGELMMLGAFTCVIAAGAGVNVWVSILVLPPIVVGAIGIILERTVIRFLYGRIVDTMLATWGISLALTGLVVTVFGNTTRTLPNPLGSMQLGRYSTSLYGLLIIAVAVSMVASLWCLLRFTRFGLILRATMERPGMSAALGINPGRVYMSTFGIGSALAGLAGGVLAPISGVSPSMGAAYMTKAFITVLGGGPAIITGNGVASVFFGTIDQLTSFWTNPVIGSVTLLLTAIALIRILPTGITGKFFRRSL
jgi:urea transport system permease protein